MPIIIAKLEIQRAEIVSFHDGLMNDSSSKIIFPVLLRAQSAKLFILYLIQIPISCSVVTTILPGFLHNLYPAQNMKYKNRNKIEKKNKKKQKNKQRTKSVSKCSSKMLLSGLAEHSIWLFKLVNFFPSFTVTSPTHESIIETDLKPEMDQMMM